MSFGASLWLADTELPSDHAYLKQPTSAGLHPPLGAFSISVRTAGPITEHSFTQVSGLMSG